MNFLFSQFSTHILKQVSYDSFWRDLTHCPLDEENTKDNASDRHATALIESTPDDILTENSLLLIESRSRAERIKSKVRDSQALESAETLSSNKEKESAPPSPVTISSSSSSSSSKKEIEPIQPTVDGLRAVIPTENFLHITQDSFNPSIFTVKEGDKKSYWFLDTLTSQYREIVKYTQAKNHTDHSQAKKILGEGTESKVHERRNAPMLAIKPTSCWITLTNYNQMLSWLYSMEDTEIQKYINVGFLKSAASGHEKLVSATINGGTILQLTQVNFIESVAQFRHWQYMRISEQNKATVLAAREKFLKADMDALFNKLEEKYTQFCQEVHERYSCVIVHSDLRAHNIMYDADNDNLVIIDCDAWFIASSSFAEIHKTTPGIFQNVKRFTIAACEIANQQ